MQERVRQVAEAKAGSWRIGVDLDDGAHCEVQYQTKGQHGRNPEEVGAGILVVAFGCKPSGVWPSDVWSPVRKEGQHATELYEYCQFRQLHPRSRLARVVVAVAVSIVLHGIAMAHGRDRHWYACLYLMPQRAVWRDGTFHLGSGPDPGRAFGIRVAAASRQGESIFAALMQLERVEDCY